MKRMIILLVPIFALISSPSTAFAQRMMATDSQISSDNHTATKEAKGEITKKEFAEIKKEIL